MTIPIGLRLPPCDSVSRLAEVAADAEALGFHEIFLPDSQMLWRDPFVAAYACLTATRTIRVGIAVSNVVTRHPTVVAGLARTLGEMADGRFDLGLGVGNSSVEPIGLEPSRQAAFRDGVRIIRSALGGELVNFGQVETRMRDAFPGVPVLMAASGPKNLALAGEMGDGVIVLGGVSPESIARSRDLVSQGAQAAGREPRELRLVVSAYAHLTDDVERDARILKPVCAAIAQKGGQQALAAAGISALVPERVPEIYPDLAHAENWDEAVEVCGRWISDEDVLRFADKFCLFGTADEINRKVHAAEEAGATSLFIQHVGSYDVPMALMNDFGTSVLGPQA